MKKLHYIIIGLLSLLFSCKKLVEVGTPENQLTTDKVFADTASATAALVNVYALFDKTIDPGYNKYLGIYTDELIYPGSSSADAEFSTSKLSPTNGTVSNIWSNYYFAVYSCNQVIEQLRQSTKIPAATVTRLTAEAKFLRAYSNFYLVNTFGPVPLILTTDVSQTAKATRSDTATVYRQIIQDLQDAQSNLPETYTGSGKVRATEWAASALLARAYLYQQNWTAAAAQATALINSGLYTLSNPSDVFFAGSSETILQFWTPYGYVTDAPSLVPSSGMPTYLVSGSLLAAFEPGDLRKDNWLHANAITSGGSTKTYYYPYKYHNRTTNSSTPEYLSALRLGEQYLIRAEAYARLGNITGSVQDLNVIRNRAGLPGLSTGLNPAGCLNAVIQEWRVEFCFEWGRRFFDLRRTGRLNTVMGAYKPTWLPKADFFPIPQKELTYDPFLTQNAGY